MGLNTGELDFSDLELSLDEVGSSLEGVLSSLDLLVVGSAGVGVTITVG